MNRALPVALLCAFVAPGCMTAVSFDELGEFGLVASRSWLTTSYTVAGEEHDSHTFVVSERSDYCGRVEQFRLDRATVADPYWAWVGAAIGWDVEQGRAALGQGDVAVEDIPARRAEWRERTLDYLAEAGTRWDATFPSLANTLYVQFARGRTYAAGDRAEHDSPLLPAFDGEGEILVGNHPHGLSTDGRWTWTAAYGRDVGNPYIATSDSIQSREPAEFGGLSAAWAPDAVGEWFRSSGGLASTTRSSVHSWDLEISDGTLSDADGRAAGGFRVWGNYYRCFLDYPEMEAPPTPPAER